MNSLTISPLITTQRYQGYNVEPKRDVNTAEISGSNNLSSHNNLSISQEARDKLQQEQREIGKKLGEQLTTAKPDKTETENQDSEITLLDKLIKEVKEQIKETQRKLAQLQNDKSDQAAEKRKLLEAQLMSLNGTLISLIGKKIKAVEEATG